MPHSARHMFSLFDMAKFFFRLPAQSLQAWKLYGYEKFFWLKLAFNLSETCSRMKLHSPLNGHGDSLKQIGCFQWFFAYGWSSFANFFNCFSGKGCWENLLFPLQLVQIYVWLLGWKYLVVLLAAALFAALATCDDVSCICESANVSTMVTSEASGFPLDHGIRVAPSGRLLSLCMSPTGSLLDEICVRKIAWLLLLLLFLFLFFLLFF